MQQQTIARAISFTGVRLHGGGPVRSVLHPAPPDRGIVFAVRRGGRPVEIPARLASVTSSRRATSLGSGDGGVATVEHLLAAAYGLGVDNLRVELDAGELPAMDGSAAPYAWLLRAAGIVAQPALRRELRLRRAVEVRDGGRVARAEPAAALRVSYAVEFDHPLIGRQELREFAVEPEGFERELAAARTFGFLHEVEVLRRAGLARGGSLANTVVLDERGVLNPEGLRWPDEFVRHKVLDLLGDLALLGVRLAAHVRVERGGHALHHRLVEEILARPETWSRSRPRGPLQSPSSSSRASRAAAVRSVNAMPMPGE